MNEFCSHAQRLAGQHALRFSLNMFQPLDTATQARFILREKGRWGKHTLALWRSRQISTFSMLQRLNVLAGRSFNNLDQYPVAPWILRDFRSAALDLADPSQYRDLTRPIGALNKNRLAHYLDRFASLKHSDDMPPFMYGSHYATAAGVAMYFLIRLYPFTDLHVELQVHIDAGFESDSMTGPCR